MMKTLLLTAVAVGAAVSADAIEGASHLPTSKMTLNGGKLRTHEHVHGMHRVTRWWGDTLRNPWSPTKAECAQDAKSLKSGFGLTSADGGRMVTVVFVKIAETRQGEKAVRALSTSSPTMAGSALNAESSRSGLAFQRVKAHEDSLVSARIVIPSGRYHCS